MSCTLTHELYTITSTCTWGQISNIDVISSYSAAQPSPPEVVYQLVLTTPFHVIDIRSPFLDILSKHLFLSPTLRESLPRTTCGRTYFRSAKRPPTRLRANTELEYNNRTLVSSCPFPSVDLIRPRPRQALLERATRTRTRPLPESASLHFRQPTWLSAAASLPVRLQGPPSGVTPTPPTFALKIDYHMRLHFPRGMQTVILDLCIPRSYDLRRRIP